MPSKARWEFPLMSERQIIDVAVAQLHRAETGLLQMNTREHVLGCLLPVRGALAELRLRGTQLRLADGLLAAHTSPEQPFRVSDAHYGRE